MKAKEHNAGHTSGADGLATLLSDFEPGETLNRLENEIKALGMTVFARINHSALAIAAGLSLRPTELLMFGNPHAGTLLMQMSQKMGIDLPLKVLVWQDPSGKTWLTYNDLCWLINRHAAGLKTESATDAMAVSLAALIKKATELPDRNGN